MGAGGNRSEGCVSICERACAFAVHVVFFCFFYNPNPMLRLWDRELTVRVDVQPAAEAPLWLMLHTISTIQHSRMKKTSNLNMKFPVGFIYQSFNNLFRWYPFLLASIWARSAVTRPHNLDSSCFSYFTSRLSRTGLFGPPLKPLMHALRFCWVSSTDYDRLCVKY